jgi:hypothetical protein
MMSKAKRAGLAGLAVLAMVASGAATAAGVDTGTSSMTAITTWLMTWIPLSAVILIVVSAIAWIAHLIRMDWAVRLVVGLIVVGSASYIVGLFGLST